MTPSDLHLHGVWEAGERVGHRGPHHVLQAARQLPRGAVRAAGGRADEDDGEEGGGGGGEAEQADEEPDVVREEHGQ